MKQILTQGIVLSRTNYGEADRIVGFLTPDQGKLRLMARGVRKVKSKLAGGIELFSVSDITFLRGRREIGTLVSSRLVKHYGHVINDLDRVQLGYDLIKQLDKATEDEPESEYFDLLETAFAALDDAAIDLALIAMWFQAQLLKLAGHTPNLISDTAGEKLQETKNYNFDLESMAFSKHDSGRFSTDDIKILRLLFSGHTPMKLQQVSGLTAGLKPAKPLLQLLTSFH